MFHRCACAAALSFLFFALPPVVHAQDSMPPDPDLPQPLDMSAYAPLLQNPPFTRTVDYTDNLRLTGVAWLEGKPMATLLDKNTKKHYVVSEEPNAQGWRLSGASLSSALHTTEVQLFVGGETVTIRYSEDQINPPRKDGKPGASSGSSSGSSSSSSTVRPYTLLSPADQEYYKKSMSKEARDKFKDLMGKVEGKMAKMTDEQRAAYAQKYFNKYKAMDTPSTGTTAAPVTSGKKSKR